MEGNRSYSTNYSTNNGTNYTNYDSGMAVDSALERAFKVLAYCVIILMSLIGNSLVIAVIYKDKRMKSNINRFIVNMCTSDILMTLWVLPERITFSLYGKWLIYGGWGDFLCKMLPLIQDVSTGVSIFSMTVIAFDRFFAILLPFRAHFITTKRCYLMICCTWLVSILLHIPYLLFNKVIQLIPKIDPTWYACRQITFSKADARKYYFVQFSMLFACPLLCITIFYTAVIIELHRKRNNADQNAEQQRIRQRENRDVSLMLITVVVLFAISWAPMNTLAFMYFLDTPMEGRNFFIFRFVADFMIHANAAQNAIIYFTFNNRFRQGLKRFISKTYRSAFESQSNGSTAATKRWNVKLNGKHEDETERLELNNIKGNEA